MKSELFIKDEISGECLKVFIKGDIDIYTAQEFKEKIYNLIDSNNKDLAIDCKNLNYIDSTGLGIFVGALKKVRLMDKNIRLENLKDNIKKLFVITGLDRLFVIV